MVRLLLTGFEIPLYLTNIHHLERINSKLLIPIILGRLLPVIFPIKKSYFLFLLL